MDIIQKIGYKRTTENARDRSSWGQLLRHTGRGDLPAVRIPSDDDGEEILE